MTMTKAQFMMHLANAQARDAGEPEPYPPRNDYKSGMVAGLEMALRFAAKSKTKKDLEPMIRAAIATINN